jgi:hypothetical protein
VSIHERHQPHVVAEGLRERGVHVAGPGVCLPACGHLLVTTLRMPPRDVDEVRYQEAARGQRQELAGSASSQPRQEADSRIGGPAGQGQLPATSGYTRSRPFPVAVERQLVGKLSKREHYDLQPTSARSIARGLAAESASRLGAVDRSGNLRTSEHARPGVDQQRQHVTY